MAVTAYTGPPGSGKSYALVGEVIVPAVGKGRRVLTNIEGVKPDALRDYCAAKWPNETPGSVVLFEGPATLQPGFFPDPDDPAAPSFMQPGDLFVMDEVRLYWPARGKFPAHITRFLRWHRHCVSAEGVSTDIVVASQILSDFHVDFKGIMARSYRFKKLTTLGLKGRFVWEAWDGPAQAKGQSVLTGGGKYQPEVFALYKSYATDSGSAVEVATDRRTSVFSRKFFFTAALLILLCIGAGVYLYRFVTQGPPGTKLATAEAATGAPGQNSTFDAAATPGAAPAAPAPSGLPVVSAVWRIAGQISTPSMHVVVLVDRAGNSRYENANNFEFLDGRPYVGTVDGQRVLAMGTQGAPPANAFFEGNK